MSNELKELTEKCQKVMRDHLESAGWKLGDDQKVFDELPNMWRKLDEAGLCEKLKQHGMTFQHFLAIAQNKYREIKIMEQVQADIAVFEDIFRRGGGK